ncbi:MAG: hypothetical protein MUF49_09925 [Oculatellaceae cyanobacterium Prado106]|jgi:hypothetical protein|nr:hypothetical protein [Oculatellaceae cyanobacterium Prado106]
MTAEFVGQKSTVGNEGNGDRCLPTDVKKMGMFLQDPSLAKLRDNYDFPIEVDYLRGTGSSRVAIQDNDESGAEVFPGLNWATEPDLSFEHFESQGLIDNPQFHQVNTFAVINRALDFVEEEIGHPLVWKDGSALVVRPHAFQGMNAYYDPMSPSLNFGFFTTPFRRAPVWTCLSHDIVTHELGHAILDTFRPLYIFSPDVDTPALHESFSDLMAMFSALQHKSVVKHLYRETYGNMRDASLITRLGEEFGQGIFGAGVPFLRSALEGPVYSKAPKQPHSRSTVWTAAIYDILERLVREQYPTGFAKTLEGFGNFSEALVNATRWIKGMLLRALHYTPPNALTMPMLARLIYEADARVFPQDSKFRDIAKEIFQQRELWNENIDLTVSDSTVGQAFQGHTGSDATTLSRIIMRHADALRIPAGTVRLISPRLITTTRQIDKVDSGNVCGIKTITEHYLEFAYEQTEYVDSFGMLVPVVVYGGGTLTMDENWNAGLIATYPELIKADPPAEEGVKQAWARNREQFDALHGSSITKTLAARNEHRTLKDQPVVPGCPFVLQKMETGAYRLMRRNCNLHDRFNGTALTKHGIVQR